MCLWREVGVLSCRDIRASGRVCYRKDALEPASTGVGAECPRRRQGLWWCRRRPLRSGWGPRAGSEASVPGDGLSGLHCDVRRKGWTQRLVSLSPWWQGIEAASCSKLRSGTGKRGDVLRVGGTGSGGGQDGGTGRERREVNRAATGARGGREPRGQAGRTRGRAAPGWLAPAAAEARGRGRRFPLLNEQIGAFQVMAWLPGWLGYRAWAAPAAAGLAGVRGSSAHSREGLVTLENLPAGTGNQCQIKVPEPRFRQKWGLMAPWIETCCDQYDVLIRPTLLVICKLD